MAELLVKEMGLTVEEFLRTFPAVAAGRPWRLEGDRIHLGLEGGDIAIRLEPLPPRRLASLELPVTRVELDLRRLDDTSARRFLHRFERLYHRGGG